MTTYNYFINVDERGEFYADVREDVIDCGELTVFEIKGFEIFEDGFMHHSKDLDGLYHHLLDIGVMRDGDRLEFGQ